MGRPTCMGCGREQTPNGRCVACNRNVEKCECPPVLARCSFQLAQQDRRPRRLVARAYVPRWEALGWQVVAEHPARDEAPTVPVVWNGAGDPVTP